MSVRELALMEHLAGGPGEVPPGVGVVVLTNLINRGWATPAPRPDAGPRLYAITETGRAALAKISKTDA